MSLSPKFDAEGVVDLQILRQDPELALGRGRRRAASGGLNSVLIAFPVAEHPAPPALDRLAHEYGLKDELDAAWAARPLDLVRDEGRTALLLEDPGGEPLERLLGAPMETGRFLRLAIDVAAALGKAHQRGLVHKDVKPANILVNCPDGQARLTGFGVASRLPRERQAAEPPEVIAGTLAYMAPEQTGRMNRSIDSRSDLYALGVTFHRMLTGVLPFSAADPMEWVHCHIARRPTPPAERSPTIPAPISDIVMKLLSKPAEERYQTAAGVERDLRRCLADWEAHGRIDDFPLGQHDMPDRLLIPEKLYGRALETETLLAAFDRIIKSGAPELVLVSGYSGIGKSAVVNELHKALVPPRGLFASGKFDQLKRDIPYSTLVQAFQSLLRPLLGRSDSELAAWRDAILEALEPNARLMTDLIPELTVIIGEQPPVPELEPKQAQTRFQLVVRRFIGVFARPDHPLALFLDDLQWLDAATLDLIEDLLTRSDLQHLMLIGAYRDNEVDVTHPLARKLDAIKAVGGKIDAITLIPLTRDDLGQLIADALRCEPERAAPLAELVHKKTAGNPFFVIQFLHALAEEGLLRFDHDAACWSWDLDRIHAMGYTDNVVDLMVGKLTRLPVETQQALQQLACLGNVAAVATLSIVLGTPEEQVRAALWPAIRQELVERLEGRYRFNHDRVQEAAYSLIPEALRAEVHLRIGRLLAAQTPPEEREEVVFEIVGQLNRGAALITEQEERDQLAELDLIAGKRAKASTAYASALAYLNAGAALLTEECWERRHDLIFALELNRAECEFLTGALAEAERRLETLSTRALNPLERASVACSRIDLYTTLDQAGRAVVVGLDYLRRLGIEWSPNPTEEEARHEYEQIWSLLGNRTIDELIELPLMTDAASLSTLDVLSKVAPAALYTNPNLYFLVISRVTNLSLERGNCDASCSAYVRLGMAVGARFGDYRVGFRFGRLGFNLVERRGLKRFQARTYMHFGNVILPMAKHVRVCRDLVRRASEAANKVGDLICEAHCCTQLTTNMLVAGDPLVEVQREAEASLAFARKSQFGFVIYISATQLELVRTLRGLTPKFGFLDDDHFDEGRIEQHFLANPGLTIPECWYWTRKLQARFFAGKYTAAVDASLRAQRLLGTSASYLEEVEYHFYGALAQAACCDSAPAGDLPRHLDALAAHHRQLQLWAENCPENFENRAALAGAEIARLEDRELDAERLYEHAIRSARANGFIHNEALANELASRFYAARGFEKIAHVYLRDARYGYLRWGADGKVRQLEEMYPHLRTEEPAPGPTSTIATPVERLDLATVIKVSQAVSGEMVLEKLIDTLMRTAIEQAGAERGLLALAQGAELRIAAEAATAGDAVHVRLRDEPVTADALPESMLNYVQRTRESAILDDAAASSPFAADPYLRQRQVRSVLCLPLLNQAKLIGVLYLENNLTPRVFAPARIAVLKLLASQAAIALENTRLYGDVAEREARIRRLVDANIIGIFTWRIPPHGSDAEDPFFVEVNDAFLRIVGYEREEFASRRVRRSDLTPPEWRARDAKILSELRASGVAQPFEKEYFRKDGGRVPVLSGAACFDETRTRGVAFVLDLTQLKRAEAALRDSEEQWKAVFENSPTMYFMLDSAQTILSVNPFGAEQLGYAPEELTGHPVEILIHEADRDNALRNKTECLERLGQTMSWELRKLRKDGSAIWARETGRAMLLKNRPVLLIVSEDITEAKRAAEALREMEMQLAHANRLETMGQLTASIAHEVNQPIAATVANAQAGLRWLRHDPANLDEVRQAFDRIARDGARAGDVVQSIRNLTKKTQTRGDRVEINAAIREVIKLTHSEAMKNGVLVRTELAEGLPPAHGDRVELQQVILNLILNAVEAMSAEKAPRELAIATGKNEPGEILVSVRDTGPGLTPAVQQNLFKAFYTTKPTGLGLGLSICRSIVESRGGRLWASANAPRGAVFQFTLPSRLDDASSG